MAKQNVTFIERHVEKIVIGVCGAYLGVCALYLVSSPNAVEVDGEKLGPKEYYARFREKAETVLGGMKEPAAGLRGRREEKCVDDIIKNLQPPKVNLPDQLQVAFVPPSPRVPDMNEKLTTTIELCIFGRKNLSSPPASNT